MDYVSFDNGNSSSTKPNNSSTKPTTATEPTTAPTTEPTTEPTQATAPTEPATKPTEPTQATEPVTTPTQPTTPAPTQPAHVHSWTTVHHDEVGHYEDVVVKAAYYEEINSRDVVVCNVCGAQFGDVESCWYHISDVHDAFGSYRVDTISDKVYHEAVTEKRYILDSAAYDERVCSECGAKG